MKFQIKCATFVRLSSVCGFFEPTTPQEVRDRLNTIRLEIVNGKILAIVTNQKIGAVEWVGVAATGESGVAHVVLDPILIAQCKAEAFLDGVLMITTIPEIAVASATTSSGWTFSGNACQWGEHEDLDDWRSWAPDEMPGKSQYVMVWNLYQVQALMECSPTGKILFPRHIDASKPIVIRDEGNEGWVGLFMAKLVSNNSDMPKIGAELPDWWRV